MYSLSELSRRLESLLLFGSISELDHANKRLRVMFDEETEHDSQWIPWPAEIGANYIRWRPLRTGIQLLLACPSGDIANAQIIGMLYSQQQPSPSDSPTIDLIEFNDGSHIEYNIETSTLIADCVGDVLLQSATKIELSAPLIALVADQLDINATVTQTGGDMTSDGISVQQHKHTEQGDGNEVSEPL